MSLQHPKKEDSPLAQVAQGFVIGLVFWGVAILVFMLSNP